MGEVWEARDEVLGRQVAVKLLLGDGADESAASRFRLEAQTAARLNHPQVVGVYDFGAWDGRFYLVMELVRGPSLAQELAARGTLDPARVARIAAQAASGLAAAHRQGVVHRDVKPGNLMLDADDTLKIGDFGIARFVDETSTALTRVGQIVGTSTYLAPERALGRMAGPASDVYALGCVLYQLLVGRPPFWADSPTALLYLHVDAVPVPPSRHRADLPPAFESCLLRMLAKQPEERPSAEEVAEWFAGPSWQGAPPAAPLAAPGPVGGTAPAPMRAAAPPVGQPVPAPAPARMPAPASMPVSAPAFAPVPAPVSARASAPLAAPASAPARRGRKEARKSKTLGIAVAGAVAFVLAAVFGAWAFGSGGGGGARQPGPGVQRVVPAEATAPPSGEVRKKGHGKRGEVGRESDD
ncbi:serine/threonine-protein kinase [Streptomyces sp. NPDC051162]|uniref:serine/threonine-protein kinase n=1 Tax=Streptomyces sp. NPDC051162 TaxID=3154747 RepID=UPI00343324FD